MKNHYKEDALSMPRREYIKFYTDYDPAAWLLTTPSEYWDQINDHYGQTKPYSVSEVSKLLGKSTSQIWKLIKRGRIEVNNVRPMRVTKSSLQNYIETKTPVIKRLFTRT